MNDKRCLRCDLPLTGKRKDALYCSAACRVAGHRAGLSTPGPGATAADRIQPSAVPARQRKPSRDDIAGLIVTAASLEASFRFASTKADYRFRPMCHRIADAIARVLAEEGLT